MSTIKSSNEDIIINADGAGSVIKFQENGVEVSTSNRIKTLSVNVSDFGVIGDGVADDTANIVLAEAEAYSLGVGLSFNSSETYLVSSRIAFRVNVDGNGCTFAPTGSGSYADTVGNSDGGSLVGSNVTFKNFTVDSSSSTIGVLVQNGENIIIENVTVINAMSGGISAYQSDNVIVKHCNISGIVYAPGGTSADGIFFGGCVNPIADNNNVSDFRRIGIVCDSDGLVKCENIIVSRNTIWDAHDCLDTSTEFNAAIWVENTHGGNVSENDCYDIAGNVGQSTSRVRGIDVNGHGITKKSNIVVNSNRIDACNITISGDSNLFSATIVDNYTTDKNSTQNSSYIFVTGVADSINIVRHSWDNVSVGKSSTDGLVLVSLAATRGVGSLTIDSISHTNLRIGADTDWSHIVFYSNDMTVDNILITNCNKSVLSVHTRYDSDLVTSFIVSDSTLAFGTSSLLGGIAAEKILISNSIFSKFMGRDEKIFEFTGVDGKVTCNNVIFSDLIIRIDTDTYVNMALDSCSFTDGSIIYGLSGSSWSLSLNGCRVYDVPVDGFILTSYYVSTGTKRLFVRNCDFSSSADNTPIVELNYDIEVKVFNGNTTTSTLLHDFASTDQDVNNLTGVSI